MKVYVAGPVGRKDEVRHAQGLAVAAGHEITFDWTGDEGEIRKEVRENLTEIEEAIAEGVGTTSFFFNLGVREPISTCPSIGVPIPATDELTNPQQVIREGRDGAGNQAIPQMAPTGVYKGETTGTFVLCVNAEGEPYVQYWEGFVSTVFASAKWSPSTHSIDLIGKASWAFSKHTPSSGTRASNNPQR